MASRRDGVPRPLGQVASNLAGFRTVRCGRASPWAGVVRRVHDYGEDATPHGRGILESLRPSHIDEHARRRRPSRRRPRATRRAPCYVSAGRRQDGDPEGSGRDLSVQREREGLVCGAQPEAAWADPRPQQAHVEAEPGALRGSPRARGVPRRARGAAQAAVSRGRVVHAALRRSEAAHRCDGCAVRADAEVPDGRLPRGAGDLRRARAAGAIQRLCDALSPQEMGSRSTRQSQLKYGPSGA